MNIGHVLISRLFSRVFFCMSSFCPSPRLAPHPAVARSRRETWPQRTTRKPSVTLILCTSNSQSPLPQISPSPGLPQRHNEATMNELGEGP